MKSIVLKQDINFLDKPLWFQNLRHDGLGFVWTDRKGYEYRSGYKPPDKIDILILFYLLLKSQDTGYQTPIEFTRREVLKECNLPVRDNEYYRRVEDSLKRWHNVAIAFQGTFYDGKEYIAIGFHIIDEYKIDKVNKQVTVWLNPAWLLKLKESHFFKYINFGLYKTLKRAVSRRLYELLCKTFKGRDKWGIHLTLLGTNLTLAPRKRRGQKEVFYASDVLVAIVPGINEINKVMTSPGIAKKLKIPPDDLFTLTYKITGEKQDRVIWFSKHLVKIPQKVGKKSSKTMPQLSREKTEQGQKIVSEQAIASETTEPSTPLKVAEYNLMGEGPLSSEVAEMSIQHQEKKENALRDEQLCTLFAQLKKKTQALKDVVGKYYDEHGHDYVLWNIRYANANAQKNYSVYLQKALECNWASEWREEQVEKKQLEVSTTDRKELIKKAIESANGIRHARYQGRIIEDVLDTGVLIEGRLTPWALIDPLGITGSGEQNT